MSKVMRRLAREVAMKIAFAELLGGNATFDEAIELSYEGTEIIDRINHKKDEADSEFAKSLVDGVKTNIEAIDEELNVYLHNWTIETISKVELTILRIAMYEIMYTDISKSVAISEAVELAKAYCDDGKHSYVNGLLGAYVRDLDNV